MPPTRVLILSMHDNTEYVLESVRAGVHGYLLKDTAATELGAGHSRGLPGRVVLQPAAWPATSAPLVRGEPARARRGALAQLTAPRARGARRRRERPDEQGDRRRSWASATGPSRPTGRA